MTAALFASTATDWPSCIAASVFCVCVAAVVITLIVRTSR